MRGAAAGGSEDKSVPAGCTGPGWMAGTMREGRRMHGLRPESGPMQSGIGRLCTPAAGHAHGRDQTKRFNSAKSKSLSISPSAEKVWNSHHTGTRSETGSASPSGCESRVR